MNPLRAGLRKPWLLPVIAAVLLHLPTLFGDLVFDDILLIERNPGLNQPGLLRQAWSRDYGLEFSNVPRGFYRPGLMTVVWAIHAVAGKAPFAYHLFSLLLFAAATAQVTRLAGALSGASRPWLAPLAGLCYAAHPGRVETVSFVMSLPDLAVEWAALIYATALVRSDGLRLREGSALTATGVGLACAFLAALFKESAFFFFAALAGTALAIALRRRANTAPWGRLALLASAGLAGLAFGVLPRLAADIQAPVTLGAALRQALGPRSLTVIQALRDVAAGVVVPGPPDFWHEWAPGRCLPTALAALSVPCWIGLAWLACVLSGRLGIALLLGWTGANVANLLILLSTGYPYSQRYLAIAPLVILLCMGARFVWRWAVTHAPALGRYRRVAIAGALLYILSLAVFTVRGSQTCLTQLDFFTAVQLANPAAAVPLAAVAQALSDAGAPAEDIALCVRRLTELDASNEHAPVLHELLVKRYLADGRYNEALAAAEWSLGIYTNAPDTMILRAIALAYLARYDKALESVDAALERRPGAAEYLTVRGEIVANRNAAAGATAPSAAP